MVTVSFVVSAPGRVHACSAVGAQNFVDLNFRQWRGGHKFPIKDITFEVSLKDE